MTGIPTIAEAAKLIAAFAKLLEPGMSFQR